MDQPFHGLREAQLRSAEQVLGHYHYEEPFPLYLKQFFRNNPKFGSRDRKLVSALCYGFFRLGMSASELGVKDRMLLGSLLCTEDALLLKPFLPPSWASAVDLPIEDRLLFMEQVLPAFKRQEIFPLSDMLCRELSKDEFLLSHLRQPDLFVRVRPGRMKSVQENLLRAGMNFKMMDSNCLALPNATKLDGIGVLNRDYVVQDLSSQRTAGYFPDPSELPSKPAFWDACAGSGGKSIMLADLYPGCQLTATDIRPSILRNLDIRFREAGLKNIQTAVVDLTVPDTRNKWPLAIKEKSFDLILADVPCSGSGTWGRDPWAMAGFGNAALEHYVAQQQQIMAALIPMVAPGKFLLYITCSVYEAENEQMVHFILKQSGLRCLKQGLIEGYREKADSMFAALFTL